MKKHILSLIAMLVFALTSKAQMFNGVYIGGTLGSFHTKIIAKGYKFKKAYSSCVYLYSGKIGLEDVEIYVIASPKTKIVSKVTVYFKEHTTFESLFESMNQKKELYTKKYGEPENCSDGFLSPYFYGDGYEEQAVQTENYLNTCLWLLPNDFAIMIKVSKYMQVQAIYENSKNQENTLKELEDAEIDKL